MKKQKQMTLPIACIVLVICIIILLVGVIILGLNPHIPIFLNIGVTIYIGVLMGYSWEDMIHSMVKMVGDNIAVVLTIGMVGIVVASFMSCGTVPLIIYYGLKIMSPKWFLLFSVLLSFLMAILTGSSFTTVGTIGVAFMGVGISMGIPTGIVAGSIVCGALCGDKHSPMGSATNLAASVSGISVYDTEKSLRYTTIPSMLLCALAFTLIGFRYSSTNADTSQINDILAALEHHYNLTPLLLIPIAVLFVMIYFKIPAIATLITTGILGGFFSIIFQKTDVASCLKYMESGYEAETGIDLVDSLLTRGGLFSMSSTLLIIILGLALAGCFQRLCVLTTITENISSLMNHRITLLCGTVIISFILLCFSSDCHMSIALTAKSMEKQFEKLHIAPEVLSRCIQDGALSLCAIIPWCSVAIYYSDTLDTPVSAFAPYFFLGYGTIIFTLITAITGIGVKKTKNE